MPTLEAARSQMAESVDAVRREFGGIRTGKATPTLLDTVRVEAYGSKVPLNQVSTVGAPEPRLLVIQPWDKSLIPEIEKGIQIADLGLNPSNDGTVVRVPIPQLNEERRKEMVRLLHKMAEEGRISIRHARQEANQEIKKREKDHELSEDDARRELDEVQQLTDEHIGKIDALLAKKEKEVLAV